MQRFKSPEQAQQFLSAHSMTYGHFRQRRHLQLSARACGGVPGLAAGDMPASLRGIIPTADETAQCVPKPVNLPMPLGDIVVDVPADAQARFEAGCTQAGVADGARGHRG
jgi:hypothetical protein